MVSLRQHSKKAWLAEDIEGFWVEKRKLRVKICRSFGHRVEEVLYI